MVCIDKAGNVTWVALYTWVWGRITRDLAQLWPVFFLGKVSRQDRNRSQGHELDFPTEIKDKNQRSGSLTTYFCSWSANTADSCEMPYQEILRIQHQDGPRGRAQFHWEHAYMCCSLNYLLFAVLFPHGSTWAFLQFALLQLKFRLSSLIWDEGCSTVRREVRVPNDFVFPLQSSLVTDVAWPRGSWRWSLNLLSQCAEKCAANYTSWQIRILYFTAFLTFLSNRILSVCVLPAHLWLLREQGTTCTWSQPNAGKLLSIWVDKCRPPICCNLVLSGHCLIQNPVYVYEYV